MEPHGHAESTSLIRPYVLTGGRTRASADDIPVETLVRATADSDAGAGSGFERPKIIELCGSPTSVAEVAAHLAVPIGVARVLVSEMVAEGLLAKYQTASSGDVELIERLINGIRAL